MEKVIFDSNAYRYLVENKSYQEIEKTIQKLKKKEEDNDIDSLMSSIVAKELLAHVANKKDKSFQKCLNAVKALYLHSGNKENFKMIASPELLIAKRFFDYEIKSNIATNNAIGQMLYHMASNPSDHVFRKFQHNLNLNRKHVEETEKEFALTMKEFVNSNGNIGDGWRVFPNDEKKRKQVLKEIRSKNSSISIALGYLTITHELIKSETPSIVNSITEAQLVERAEQFIDVFKEPILLFKQVMENLVNSEFNIFENSRANFVWDIHLMFNVGDHRLNDGSILYLVTSDKAMIKAATEGNGRLNVFTFDEYIEYLG